MHRFRLALIIGAIVVAAVFVAGGAASLSKGSSTGAKSGGTVVFGAEQEPPCLNGFTSGCNNTWTSWTVGTQQRGLMIENPDYSIVNDMAQSVKVIKTKPETIAVTIIVSKLAQNTPWSWSLFNGGETFAAKIANNAQEFDNPQKAGAFIAAGLVLFVLTFVVNAIARIVIERRKAFSE